MGFFMEMDKSKPPRGAVYDKNKEALVVFFVVFYYDSDYFNLEFVAA